MSLFLVTGTVSVTSNGQTRMHQQGPLVDSLPFTITTGPDSRASLTFPFGAIVELQADTAITVSRYDAKPVTRPLINSSTQSFTRYVTAIILSSGTLLVTVPPLNGAQGSNFTVETPQGDNWSLAPTATATLRISFTGKPRPTFQVGLP